jgi:histidyl-tRNA synthetase
MIEPRTLKGFRDYPPALMIPRERVLQTAREVYRRYGFAPIDTPAMEYAEVLLGKGGEESDRIVYRFKDHGDRDVALRFDLTVPFARFSAQHIGTLGTPFKRYAMGPVWRGENTSAGRYREFWQCDFDTIGTTCNAADIEVAIVIHDLFKSLEFENFEIRVNNRLVLNGVLELLGVSDQSVPLLRCLDKLGKLDALEVADEMRRTTGVTEDQAYRVLSLADFKSDNERTLDQVSERFKDSQKVVEGITKLRELLSVCKKAGVNTTNLKIDLSIARGLDYYTGTIYETFLTDLPAIGSVCSGGRYDNLASLYTKQVLPGVGASLGVDRLLAAMEELKHPWLTGAATPAPVLVLNLDAAKLGEYQMLARQLRKAGIGAEVYPEAKKLGAQFQYAEKRGFALAVIAGEAEFASNTVKVKQLQKRIEEAVDIEDFVERVKSFLNEPRA